MATVDEPRGLKSIPCRYLTACMGSVGLAILYGFKVNLSVTMVAMVNHTAIELLKNASEKARESSTDVTSTTISPYISAATTTLLTNATKLLNQSKNITNVTNIVTTAKDAEHPHKPDGPFVWDSDLQGLILASYFGGYIVSLMPGGMLAEYVSAKWVLNVSVLLNVIASLMMPMAAKIHYAMFIVMRVIQGIGGGVSFPAIHVIISKWAPPNERSILASIAYAGTALGTVISILLSGMIAVSLSWEWVFYIEALLCLIWCTAWGIMIQDSPEKQKMFITNAEREYIANSQGQTKESHKMKLSEVPWFQIMKSPPFLAILVAHFCSNFGWYMLLTQLPKYMDGVLNFDLKDNALLSALPFFCMWLFTMGLSKALAVMQNKNWISVTVSRKIGTLFASAIPMFCLLAVTYVGKNTALAVALMTISVTCIGGMYCGFLANHIDLAPNFAGTLVAITNTIATIPGIVVPIFVGYLIKGKEKSVESWRVIFFLTVGLYIIEMLFYTMFGTGEEQPWNKIKSHEERPEQTVPLKEARH